MFNIDEPLLLDDILPPSENLEILNHLSTIPWYFAEEGNYGNNPKVKFAFLNDVTHVGYNHIVHDLEKSNYIKSNFNTMLFIWPRIITSIITNKLNIKYKNLYRIHWNYYYKDQQGVGHIDHEKDNYISIVYNPHTTDGGTRIKNNFYQDKIGQAKIFKSNWPHGAICCRKDKARTSLNIILEI